MHRTLKKLYRDHAHFNQLMDILEQQLIALTGGSQTASNLLQELVRYSHDYADGIHHPIEDQLYEVMLARTDDGREIMEELLVQHLQITNMTLKLKQVTAEPLAGATDNIEQLGLEYVQFQRQHMQFEEKEAFPLLRASLGDQDFDDAAGAIPAEEDPLENSDFRKQYPALFTYLERNPA